jgi:alpha-L-fucosidase
MPVPDWFGRARFGMFVHFGPASQHGWELSWPLVGGNAALPRCQDVPAERYHAGVATFRPEPGAPRVWCDAARRAGMRYVVLTTKHHDGFSLWPSRAADWSIARTPYRGDLVREFASAAREAGLRLGFYFSLSDWHHPDYPAFEDADRPYRYGLVPRPTPAQWERFHAVLVAQLRELLTDYGRVDLLWFDGGWERSSDEWRSAELEALIRELQPDVVLNDRLPGVGDYATPEQIVPAVPPAGPWETCLTMNESWGWNPDDPDWKSPRALVHALCETAGRGGNLLLNVGPMADGSLPPPACERLDAIAGWMAAHGESVHDTVPGLEAWQFYGPSTRRGSTVYLHCLMRPYESVVVRGVPVRRVRDVRALGTGVRLATVERVAAVDRIFNADPTGALEILVPEALVDPLATVVAFDLAD